MWISTITSVITIISITSITSIASKELRDLAYCFASSQIFSRFSILFLYQQLPLRNRLNSGGSCRNTRTGQENRIETS